MDGSKRSIEEYQVTNDVVEDLLSTLEILKDQGLDTSKNTCTINGFQTENILKYKTPQEVAQKIIVQLKKDLNLFHIHLIEYNQAGAQTAHDHKETEDYSFILYLNDSDGNTVFENHGEITPKKGKLVFFNSDITHYGKPSMKGKKIAVGALKKH